MTAKEEQTTTVTTTETTDTTTETLLTDQVEERIQDNAEITLIENPQNET